MPSDAVEIVRRNVESRGRDMSAFLADLDPAVVWDVRASRSPYRGLYEGRDAVERLWGEVSEAWGRLDWTMDDAEVVGDCVVATVTGRGQGAASGVPGEATGSGIYTLRSGRITSFELFQTMEEALEAARCRSAV